MPNSPFEPPKFTKRLIATAALALFAIAGYLVVSTPSEREPSAENARPSPATVTSAEKQPVVAATTGPEVPAPAPPAGAVSSVAANPPPPAAPAMQAAAVVAPPNPRVSEPSDEFGIPEVPGAMAIAVVETDGKPRELRPNQVGEFPRVLAAAQQNIPVRIQYPTGDPDEEVSVTVQDGGRINEREIARVLRLNAERTVAFHFQTGDNDGLYRVSLRKGTDLKTFAVWVGPEPKLAGRADLQP